MSFANQSSSLRLERCMIQEKYRTGMFVLTISSWKRYKHFRFRKTTTKHTKICVLWADHFKTWI